MIKINNPQPYGLYLLSKKELLVQQKGNDVEEQMLYHATSIKSTMSIAENNIN